MLNEVALHRGRFPHLVQIEIYVDGMPLTEAVADGLIVSTPTGSSAYSVGSKTHNKQFCLTHKPALCWWTARASLRAVHRAYAHLPAKPQFQTCDTALRLNCAAESGSIAGHAYSLTHTSLQMSSSARSNPDVSLDGREVLQLENDNYIQISMSPYRELYGTWQCFGLTSP